MSRNTIDKTLLVAKRTLAFAFFFAVSLGLTLQPVCAQEPEKEGAGLIVSGQAGAKDVGLPIYPGSRPHKEKADESQSARLGLWGGGSGFKLNVMKMESPDSPEKVAAFYKKALAKYGKVLDCSNPSSTADREKKVSSEALTCGDDKPDKGGMLFKSGTKEKQHMVGIQPHDKGSLYQLVALVSWGGDSKH
jgi:hypothetical protein